MSQKIKKIKDPGRFLLDKGLLFEINRKVLHPLGLAMEFDVDDNDKAKFSGIWDFMDDPEGIIYDDEVLEDGAEKYNKFMEEHGNERLKTRKEKLGYVIQEPPKED